MMNFNRWNQQLQRSWRLDDIKLMRVEDKWDHEWGRVTESVQELNEWLTINGAEVDELIDVDVLLE